MVVTVSLSSHSLHPSIPLSCSCEGIDTVMVFVVTNGNKVRIDNFCGVDIPAQLMSNGPSLRVEFKSMHPITAHNSRGFKAIYQFVTSK